MRQFSKFAVRAALAGAVLAALSGAAGADGRYRDRAYADSFGNLVVYSPAGYKRIVVGEGHLAKQLNAYTGAGNDDPVVYYNAERGVVVKDCPAVLLKGRSYMYGLPDHVVPQPALDYCD